LNIFSHAILALIGIRSWLYIPIKSSFLGPGYFVDDRFFDFLVGQSINILVLHVCYNYKFRNNAINDQRSLFLTAINLLTLLVVIDFIGFASFLTSFSLL